MGAGSSVYNPIAAYVYDGNGSRVQQVDHTGSQPITITYTNDNLGLSQVLAANDGTTTTHNLLGLDLISQQTNGQTNYRFLLADGLGSVHTEMVDGEVETVTTYEPYGNLLAQTGTSGTVYGFTGEQHNSATNLVFLRARYYNPALRVFLSRDPFSGWTILPGTQHSYSYVSNNPVNKVDPTGKVEQWWENMLHDPGWKQVFLDSATRHNQQDLTGLDNIGFASILASVVLIENKDIGGDNPNWFKRTIGNIVNPMSEKWRIPIIAKFKILEILFGSGTQSEGICNINPEIVDELAQYPEIVLHIYGPENPSPVEEIGNGCTFPGVSCEGNSIQESYSSAYDPDPAVREARKRVVEQIRQDNNIELLAAKFEYVTIRLRNAGIDGSLPDPTPLRNPGDPLLTIATRNFAQYHARGVMESLGPGDQGGNWWSESDMQYWLPDDADRQKTAQYNATDYFHAIRGNWWSAHTGLSSTP